MDWISEFYKLPKDDRWLDSPYQVGGHDTEITQVGYSLGFRIRELFPMNQVPPRIEAEFKAFMETLTEAEERMGRVCSLINKSQAEKIK